MIRRLFTLLLAAVWLAAPLTPAQLQAQVAQVTHKKQVEKIDIVLHRVTADSAIDPASIRARMKTKVGESFSQLDFDQDLKQLADEFDRIEPTVEAKGNRITITLNVWPKAVIGEIRFCGNEKIKDKKLREELDVPKGTVFNRHTFSQAFHKLKDYYIRKGYFEAELSYDIVQDPNSNEVDIEIKVCEGRSGRVKQICFEGFSKEDRSEILSMIQTKKYCLLISFFTQSGTYHEEMVEQDRYIVLNYLHNQGYADAQVEIDVSETCDGGGIILTLKANKGPCYHFGRITFCGNECFPNELVSRSMAICSGQVYSPEKLRKAVQELSDLYGEKGYIEAIVNYEPRLNPETRCYDVHFDIEEGEQYRVGLVRVFGNHCTMQGVILHESLLEPGDIFDIRKLQKTEETLEHVGYFETVNVYAVKGSSDSCLGPNYRDVYIEVEETGTGNVSFFAGYSTIDSVFGGFEVIERNFNIRGIPCVPCDGFGALRGGGEFIRARVNIGQKADTYSLGWTKPFFMDTPWIVGADTEYNQNRRISKSYELNSFNVGLHATYPVNKFLAVGGHYRIRDLKVKLEISKIEAEANKAKEKPSGETPVGEPPPPPPKINPAAEAVLRMRDVPNLLEEAQNDGKVSAIAGTFVYDSVDNTCDPSNGFRSLGSVELAGLGGQYTFLHLSYVNTLYYQLYKCGVLKLRGDAHFVCPFGRTNYENLPLQERLFLGGETTVRGYRSFSIGPMYDNGDPRGGLSSVLLSAELAHKFHRRFHAFVFCDAGYNTLEKWGVAPLRTSVGLGIRFELMQNVPITLGYGWPLNAVNDSQEQKFFFALGGAF